MNTTKKVIFILATILAMVLGSWLAYMVTSSFGYVTVQDIRFYGPNSEVISAHLYVPADATAQNPAPGILAIHGYNNQKEYMANTALELARRGYVVLAIDMTGHGFSEGAVGSFSYGAVAGLNYLRSLAYVDKNNIGLVGMSMGGWAIQAAALAVPDGYKSMFYMDSYVLPPTLAPRLKNVAIQMSFADEFTPYWLQVPTGRDIPKSPVLKIIFNVTEDIVPGKVYGDISKGTARILYEPYIDHAASTDDPVSIGNVVEWMGMTLQGGKNIPRDNMIFPLKQLFTSIAFIAAIAFIFIFGSFLLDLRFFQDLVSQPAEYKGFTGVSYWVAALITTALGPLLFLPTFIEWGMNTLLINEITPQAPTNRYVIWMDTVAVVTVALLLLFYYLTLKKKGFTVENTGLKLPFEKILKSFLFAAVTLAPVYVILAYCYAVFRVPFTLAGLPEPIVLRPMSLVRFSFMASYFLPFLFYYLVIAVLFYGFMRYREGKVSVVKEILINSIIISAGSVVFLLYYYLPLYLGMPQTLSWSYVFGGVPLAMIYYIVVPIISIITVAIITFFNRKTGSVWTGAFIAALLITWYNVAFAAFHVPMPP
ncbi:MAG: alpha/beta fold hydrolase [Infirmifilum sp.]